MAEAHFRPLVFPSHPPAEASRRYHASSPLFFASYFHPRLSRSWTLRSGPPAAGSPAGRQRSPGGLIKSPLPDRTIRKTSPAVRLACSHVCFGLPGSCSYALALKGHMASAWGGKSSTCRELWAVSSRGDSKARSKVNV